MKPTLPHPIRRRLAPALLCMAVLPFSGQAASTKGSGRLVTDSRSVAPFQAVHLLGSVDLQVRQGPQSVQVLADDNLQPLIETVVENSSHGPTLVVRMKRGESLSTRNPLVVRVSVPKLTAVTADGAGNVLVEAFSTPSLKLTLSGSGDAALPKLNAAEVSVSLAGSGNMEADGKAGQLKLNISGSGDLRLAELKADTVSVNISGSGNAAVHASRALEVNLAGSGDVSYSGKPALKSTVTGSGSVMPN